MVTGLPKRSTKGAHLYRTCSFLIDKNKEIIFVTADLVVLVDC